MLQKYSYKLHRPIKLKRRCESQTDIDLLGFESGDLWKAAVIFELLKRSPEVAVAGEHELVILTYPCTTIRGMAAASRSGCHQVRT